MPIKIPVPADLVFEPGATHLQATLTPVEGGEEVSCSVGLGATSIPFAELPGGKYTYVIQPQDSAGRPAGSSLVGQCESDGPMPDRPPPTSAPTPPFIQSPRPRR